ncbi:MAG: hypothetical protein PF505_13210 [Vallitaleaceae bacterium]|jgi:menaquinone-dependent protoporphyrinogen oxidase|nr:hypothetical protein [Vallitaleaceae bacterium]
MKRIIIYGTKHGATKTISNKLAELFAEGATIIDVNANLEIKEIYLSDYDQVIVGSSIYMGQINKKLKKYIQDNEGVLLKKKLGIFLSSGLEDPMAFENNFSEELLNHSSYIGFLGSEIILSKLSFIEKAMVKAMKTKEYSKIYDDEIFKMAEAFIY